MIICFNQNIINKLIKYMCCKNCIKGKNCFTLIYFSDQNNDKYLILSKR
jgi:hypothetical protein